MRIIIREDRDSKSRYEKEFELDVAPQAGDRLMMKMTDTDNPVVEFEVKTVDKPPQDLKEFSYVVTLHKVAPYKTCDLPYMMRFVLVKEYAP